MVGTRSGRGDSSGPDSFPVSTTATPASSVRAKRSTPRASRATSSGFEHAPTAFTLAWMAISLPLVVWDTGYVLGRPHTMEGGAFFWPLYVPYKLYGTVDHVYGWKAWEAHNGFTAAQGLLNLVETVMYFAYLYLWYANGTTTAVRGGATAKTVRGRSAALAVLLGFSAAVMTLSKTVLYWANEYYSGFDNIGHNSLMDLIFLWIIPNGAWLVGSAYMIWSLGLNILDGLASHSKSD